MGVRTHLDSALPGRPIVLGRESLGVGVRLRDSREEDLMTTL